MNRRSKRYERGIAMQINKEIIAIELGKLIDRFFQLPEVTAVKVRGGHGKGRRQKCKTAGCYGEKLS